MMTWPHFSRCHILVPENKTKIIKHALTWKLHAYWLSLTVPEVSLHATGGEKLWVIYSDVYQVNNHNNWSVKICSLVQ